MENFFAPPTTTNSCVRSNMGCSQNVQFSINEPQSYPSTTSTSSTPQFDSPAQYKHPHESLQFPYVLPSGHAMLSLFCLGPNGIEIGLPNSIPIGLSELQEQKIWESYKTKAARSNRKLARKRSASLSRNPSGVSSGVSSSSRVITRRLTMYGADTAALNNNENVQKDHYTFCTPDNKKLRVLLRKELKNSDVGNLGRIVLPKKEAEANLPSLSDKEGIPIVIIDVYSNQEWGMRYKYWPNNKSRMYILENTGDFVKQNALENGDCITLYEDESKNLTVRQSTCAARVWQFNFEFQKGFREGGYSCSIEKYFSIKRMERPACKPSNKHYIVNCNYNNNYAPPYTYEARDEDEASLALLIQELRHKEQQEANSLLTLPIEAETSSSNNVTNEANPTEPTMAVIEPSSSSKANMMGADGHRNDFDDCYSGLGTLPVASRYSYSLFYQFMNELPEVHGDDMIGDRQSELINL